MKQTIERSAEARGRALALEPRFHDCLELRTSAPRPIVGLIDRAALLERVGRAGPLAIVQAPAGYGKSVLMRQVFAECLRRGEQAGWITLQACDNDISSLVRLLSASLHRLRRSAGASVIPFRPAAAVTPLDSVVEQLLQFDAPLTLFIDDFDVLDSRAAIGFFRELISAPLPGARLVIGTKSEPALGLARLIVGGQAELIDARDLKLSHDEVQQLFAGIEPRPSSCEIAAIHRETAGWPALAELYRLALVHAEAHGPSLDPVCFQPRRLTDYLLENVLLLHTEETQRFLIETAPLDRLSAALCKEITGRESRELLMMLACSGLLTRSIDGTEEWFEHVPAFSRFLQAQLRLRSPQRALQVHGMASRWFRRHGQMEEALGHALAAHEPLLAADCLETWSTDLIMRGQLAEIVGWFEKLPLQSVRHRRRLLMQVAWALAFLRRRERLEQILGLLEQQRESMSAADRQHHNVLRSLICILQDDIAGAQGFAGSFDDVRDAGTDPFDTFEAGATAILKGHLSLLAGQLEQARDQLLIGRVCGAKVGSSFSVLGSIATTAMNLMVQGRLLEASRVLEEASADVDGDVTSAALHASRIHVLFEANHRAEARQLFDRTFPAIAGGAQVDFLAVASVAMVRMFDESRQHAQANALIEEVEGIARAESLPRLVNILTRERIRQYVLAGDLDRARALLARIDDDRLVVPAGWIPFSEETEDAAICRARLAIHENRVDEVHRLLTPALVTATRLGRVHRQIKLQVLLSMAQYRGGHHSDAFKRMRKAVKLAAVGGYVRAFLDEGSVCLGVLRHLQREELSLAEAQHIRLLLGTASQTLEATPFACEPLSSREEDILKLLARGMFNREIGARLFISENTVKYHLKNIYSKLGVKNRGQAIKYGHLMTTGLQGEPAACTTFNGAAV